MQTVFLVEEEAFSEKADEGRVYTRRFERIKCYLATKPLRRIIDEVARSTDDLNTDLNGIAELAVGRYDEPETCYEYFVATRLVRAIVPYVLELGYGIALYPKRDEVGKRIEDLQDAVVCLKRLLDLLSHEPDEERLARHAIKTAKKFIRKLNRSTNA